MKGLKRKVSIGKELALLLMKEIQKNFQWWRGKKALKWSSSLMNAQALLMDAPEPPEEEIEEKYIQTTLNFYRERKEDLETEKV